MFWVALWSLLLLAAAAVLGLICWSIWKKSVALAREVGAASDRISAAVPARDAAPAAEVELAVFADPESLKRRRRRELKARERSVRHRSASGARRAGAGRPGAT